MPMLGDQLYTIILLVLFLVGCPTNLIAFTQQRQTRTITNRSSAPHVPSRDDLDSLKYHLNIADLLVLFIFCPSEVFSPSHPLVDRSRPPRVCVIEEYPLEGY